MDALKLSDLRALWLRLRWEVNRYSRRVLRRAGWGSVVIALGVLVAFGFGLLAIELSEHARYTTQRADELRKDRETRPPMPVVSKDTLPEQFYAALPGQDELPAAIQTLFSLARERKVRLGAGEYRLQGIADSRSNSYRIRLPISGPSASVQSFVLDALRAQPSLTVESLSLRRERVEAPNVEANVQFVLFSSNERRVSSPDMHSGAT